jgi:hypothetical protein
VCQVPNPEIERIAFSPPLRVAALNDVRTQGSRCRCRVVGAVVGYHNEPIPGEQLPLQVLERWPNTHSFVMRRHQYRGARAFGRLQR